MKTGVRYPAEPNLTVVPRVPGGIVKPLPTLSGQFGSGNPTAFFNAGTRVGASPSVPFPQSSPDAYLYYCGIAYGNCLEIDCTFVATPGGWAVPAYWRLWLQNTIPSVSAGGASLTSPMVPNGTIQTAYPPPLPGPNMQYPAIGGGVPIPGAIPPLPKWDWGVQSFEFTPPVLRGIETAGPMTGRPISLIQPERRLVQLQGLPAFRYALLSYWYENIDPHDTLDGQYSPTVVFRVWNDPTKTSLLSIR